jgi:hypothetical protein
MLREVVNGQISKSQAEASAMFFNNLSPGLALKAKDFRSS